MPDQDRRGVLQPEADRLCTRCAAATAGRCTGTAGATATATGTGVVDVAVSAAAAATATAAGRRWHPRPPVAAGSASCTAGTRTAGAAVRTVPPGEPN